MGRTGKAGGRRIGDQPERSSLFSSTAKHVRARLSVVECDTGVRRVTVEAVYSNRLVTAW